MTNTDKRYTQLNAWVSEQIKDNSATILPLSGDASFRRYFRVQHNDQSLIAMDAPPEREDCRPFVAIAKGLAQHGLKPPRIISENLSQGFLLISDFGDQLYLDALNPESADRLYQSAFDTLLQLQQIKEIPHYVLPPYDEAHLREEINLFRDWYLPAQSYDYPALPKLERLFNLLIDSALEQPQVCVHRDYHSRNLMLLADNSIGLLDFQDAVWGPITYDPVSLLRDCYIDWPLAQVNQWALDYQQRAETAGLLPKISADQFLRWFDWMGIQRHLKVLGIFTRLYKRDGKSGYLKDIPRTRNYVLEVCKRYPELHSLLDFMGQN